MKNVIFIGFLIASLSVLADAYRSPQHDRVVTELEAQESVFEAVWFNPQYLKLTRYKQATPQHGFAEYVCSVLVDTGFKGPFVDVEIIDVIKLVRQKEWDVIGEARCSYHPRR